MSALQIWHVYVKRSASQAEAGHEHCILPAYDTPSIYEMVHISSLSCLLGMDHELRALSCQKYGGEFLKIVKVLRVCQTFLRHRK